MLRPIAQTGQDPVYSMGDDAPIAPLAGRARPLASYFRQRFAQVTNPAIDHYRERAVMSISTLIGARAPLDAEGVLPPLVVLPSFLVTPAGLAALEAPEIDATFSAAEGLGAAVERVADACVELAEGGATRLRPHRCGSGRRTSPRPCAARRRRRPRPPRRARPAHGLLAPRVDGRGQGHPHGRDARRLRRRRRLPAARARDGRAPRRDRQGRRRPAHACRGAGASPALARGRRPQGDVEDGDLGRRELQRRAPVRGRGPRPPPLQAVLRRHRPPRSAGSGSTGSSATRSGGSPPRWPRSRRSRTRASTSSARAVSLTRPTPTSSSRCRRASPPRTRW